MNIQQLYKLLDRFPPLRQNKLYDAIQKIIAPLFFKLVSKLFSKEVDEKLIIMSSQGGTVFAGNARHLFEYIHYNTNYRCIWLCKTHDLVEQLRKKGYEAIYKFNIKAIKLLRRARFIFTTHGVFDVLPIEFSPNTTYIETWHGVQNKKNLSNHGPIIYPEKLVKLLQLSVINDKVYDYFITPSGTKKDIDLVKSYFQISPKKILTTGYPRNDCLFNNNVQKIRRELRIPKTIEHIFVYAPTYRDNGHTILNPLANGFQKTLNDTLIELNAILLVKKHPYEYSLNFDSYSNIYVIDEHNDIQELLIVSDALITDYSSVYCDYLLLDRPIFFFVYDYEDFLTHGRGFYYDFEKIAPGPLIKNVQGLINCLKNFKEIGDRYSSKRTDTCNLYNKYIDGNSTTRLLTKLKII
jgi:CDP-glycerol glycerophosphotransferase